MSNGDQCQQADLPSLEFEEDCYYAFVEKSDTPSFDVVGEENDDGCAMDMNWWPTLNGDDCTFVLVDDNYSDTEDLLTDSGYSVEAEFFEEEQLPKKEQRWKKWRLLRRGDSTGRSASTSGKKLIKAVRVRFEDLSKPYLAKITSQKNYTKFLQLVKESPPADISPDSGINDLSGMSPEDQEKQKEQWAEELAELEGEMKTLRDVLANKMKKAQELKRKLGFSVWKEFQDDMTHGIKSVKESNVYHTVEEKVGNISRAVVSAPIYHTVEEKVGNISQAVVSAPIYQKTESVIKATTEKTTSLLGGLGSGISTKLGQLKNSESFRSFEEKVGTAYENVKTKVVTSRSSSMQNFDEAVREAEGRRNLSTASTPTISEDAPRNM